MNITEPYQLFSDPLKYYNAMIVDIESAQKYVYLETFRIAKDEIGERFRHILTKKAKEGVIVKILVDYWGAGSIDQSYFEELIKYNGEVRFFEKIIFNTDVFTKSHRRNHRKLLLIDDSISYIGSSNITGYNMNWRESVLRMTDNITPVFVKLFMQDFRNYNKYIQSNNDNTKTIINGNFEIIRDAPSIKRKNINRKFIKLIKEAKRSITIETPYFLPGFFMRKALIDATLRGIQVNIIMPKHSDVGLIDILRNKYFGILYKSGISILFFEPNNLHAKLLLIDRKIFAIGSSNFDYRSFRYMYEIMMFGVNRSIATQVHQHTKKTISDSSKFDYEKWKNRPLINRFFEWLLLPFRHLL